VRRRGRALNGRQDVDVAVAVHVDGVERRDAGSRHGLDDTLREAERHRRVLVPRYGVRVPDQYIGVAVAVDVRREDGIRSLSLDHS
jgi:hypothetical protein